MEASNSPHSEYDVNRKDFALYASLIAPVLEFGGLIIGIPAVINKFDFEQVVLGGALYVIGKGLSRAIQYATDSERFEKLEERLKK
jgi:hypothetical protein